MNIVMKKYSANNPSIWKAFMKNFDLKNQAFTGQNEPTENYSSKSRNSIKDTKNLPPWFQWDFNLSKKDREKIRKYLDSLTDDEIISLYYEMREVKDRREQRIWSEKYGQENEIDALYIRLQEKYVNRTVEIEEGLNIDLDESGKMIGLEVLDAADRYSLADIFNISTENLILEKALMKKVVWKPVWTFLSFKLSAWGFELTCFQLLLRPPLSYLTGPFNQSP